MNKQGFKGMVGHGKGEDLGRECDDVPRVYDEQPQEVKADQ